MNVFEEIQEDFKRELELSTYPGKFQRVAHALTAPGFQAVLGYRISRWFKRYRIPLLPVVIQRFMEIWAGVSISPRAEIGSGLVVYHFGGIVINAQTVMGKDCTLHHGVTIGNRLPGGLSPRLGNRVVIGTGAVLIGDITIGNEVEIGANAVVLESVPDGGIAVGIPAKVVRTKELRS